MSDRRKRSVVLPSSSNEESIQDELAQIPSTKRKRPAVSPSSSDEEDYGEEDENEEDYGEEDDDEEDYREEDDDEEDHDNVRRFDWYQEVALVDYTEELKSNGEVKTKKQELLLNYVRNCEKRLTDDFSMTDFEYLVQPTYTCEECGEVFNWKDSYEAHYRIKHQLLKLRCLEPDCGYSCWWMNRMKLHIRQKHSDNATEYRCSHAGCESGEFHDGSSLARHIREQHDGEADFFACPNADCKKTFYRLESCKKHFEIVHGKNKKQFRCMYPDCGSSYS
ncbi:hypothetical protein MBANPS3_008333 [Mucor bainieri]